MKTWICVLGLWLVGICSAVAFDMGTAETLAYKVSWGPLSVGKAWISYTPGAKGAYSIKALVKDDSSFIDMDDAWEVTGVHLPTRSFAPAVYHVRQAENHYRADKTMTFDGKTKKVSYSNLRDKTDVAVPLVLGEARDALSTVFMWRLGGVEEVKKGAQVPMIGVKKQITLQRDAGRQTTLTIAGREMPVWMVKMTTVQDGKLGKSGWTVYLRDDASLKPVQIVAATKFGTFRATLKE